MSSNDSYTAVSHQQIQAQTSIEESGITPTSPLSFHHDAHERDSAAPEVDDGRTESLDRPSTEASSIHDIVTQSQVSITTHPLHSEISSPSELQRLTIKDSIGIYGLLILVLGTFTTLASLGFIIFLWTGQGSSLQAVHASPSWRAIIIAGWLTQATTLAALIIRASAAAQATVCTAMLSALFLEKQAVPKSEAPQFSILRTVNDGPVRLAQLIFKRGQFSRMLCIETILVFALVVSTLSLQFSSTILFSDLHDFQIAENSASFPVNDYISEEVEGLYVTDFSQLSPPNAIFGELPSTRSVDPDSAGFSITRPVKRAFLPLKESQNRTSIHAYSGNTVTVSSNVACMRPIMQSTYQGKQWGTGLQPEPFSFGEINGTLHYGESLQKAHSITSLCDSKGCLTSDFHCSLPGGYEAHPGWGDSLCLIDAVNGDSPPSDAGVKWNSTTEPWSDKSISDWNASRNVRGMEAIPATDIGEWKSFEIQQDRFINVTLCFSSFHAELTFGNWSTIGVGDSSKVRKYLGVSDKNSTLADRGLLTINDIRAPQKLAPLDPNGPNYNDSSKPQQTLAERGASDYEALVYYQLTYSSSDIPSIIGCNVCTFLGNTQNPQRIQILQDTIAETKRAADAIQAWTTSISNTIYYDFLSSFNAAEQIGGGNGLKGLISVIALVSFHLVCVGLTSIFFVRRTQYSRQGNTWHTISQLIGPELNSMLERSDNMDDSTIAKEAKENGDNVLVRLEKTGDGRIGLVRKEEQPKSSHKKEIASDEAVLNDA
ncbi:hypothetical protein F5B22DRAFT_632663 [Xylaria bambusicola]|uniref:uncharacterized protein n=1 Tax=Xylaria bambusicola TaxID=326684 RepID=UPI002008C4F1|nr:uncharacterized protein F5B22DRAFT_632663 [Xylaria bambusicola]KAI0528246.1 hypothetical protein F5B22DRAFT_632663 [Xylaria bambusicola]